MNNIVFIFKKGFHHYLVPECSLNDAWISLALRQSMSIDNCKRGYSYLGTIGNKNKEIWKI